MPSLAGYGLGCQVPLLCSFAIESVFQVLCSSFQYSPSQIIWPFNFPAQNIQQQLYLFVLQLYFVKESFIHLVLLAYLQFLTKHERSFVYVGQRLLRIDKIVQELLQEQQQEGKQQEQQKRRIDIRYIEPSLQTKVTVLIIDRKFSLSIELKDDTKDNSYETIGLATYSNSTPTVLSYVSIFESLWTQSQLYEQVKEAHEQLKMHDKLQKEFIDVAAHELRTPIQPILGLSQVLQSKI